MCWETFSTVSVVNRRHLRSGHFVSWEENVSDLLLGNHRLGSSVAVEMARNLRYRHATVVRGWNPLFLEFPV